MTQNGPEAKDANVASPNVASPYVNHLAISFDLAEVRIDFGQLTGTDTPPRIASRVVTSPANFSRFHRQICESMRQYSGTFGEPDPTAKERG